MKRFAQGWTGEDARRSTDRADMFLEGGQLAAFLFCRQHCYYRQNHDEGIDGATVINFRTCDVVDKRKRKQNQRIRQGVRQVPSQRAPKAEKSKNGEGCA